MAEKLVYKVVEQVNDTFWSYADRAWCSVQYALGVTTYPIRGSLLFGINDFQLARILLDHAFHGRIMLCKAELPERQPGFDVGIHGLVMVDSQFDALWKLALDPACKNDAYDPSDSGTVFCQSITPVKLLDGRGVERRRVLYDYMRRKEQAAFRDRDGVSHA